VFNLYLSDFEYVFKRLKYPTGMDLFILQVESRLTTYGSTDTPNIELFISFFFAFCSQYSI
jgi:hypothetical protein